MTNLRENCTNYRRGSGIGRSTALLFAQYEAKVVITSRNSEKGKEDVKYIQEEGGDSLWIKTDVSQS